jgi:type III restriction enzyme
MLSGAVEAQPIYGRERIDEIAARMDLRQPNREALESIAIEIGQHYVVDDKPPPFEAVVDSATGVGKTYILAAAIEYLVEDGARNFAVIAPGRTILDKTVANFTPGHPKSLLPNMRTRPVVITSENFATAAMRSAMDDDTQIKLFIFTVQALLKPQTKLGRKTHKFQEGLGEAFYDHLRSLDDLTIFADEHHTYFGPAFSEAVRGLEPRVLLGLTATPHKKTPDSQVIYRYPLAAAIADRLVKTPVLVGRRDDRTDAHTKLLDGVRLLELKEQAVKRWTFGSGDKPVTPMMLVIAPTIEEANEVEQVVSDPGFAEGRYAGKVLTVHSDAPDEALAHLGRLEDAGSPYRIVISVGMLKEGWDVKNVYVICSLRASISDVLTEQTLGRGMRLPFGRYTGIEILDTLEVMAHDRYEDLLKKAKILNEQFIDTRSRAVLRRNLLGQETATVESFQVAAPLALDGDEPGSAAEPGRPLIADVETYTAQAQQAFELQVMLEPKPSAEKLRIPRLRMTPLKAEFSLADITDHDSFRKLGQGIAADPDGTLRRVTVSAHVIEDLDGIRRTELVTAAAVDHVPAQITLVPLDALRERMIVALMNSSVVPARPKEKNASAVLVDEFLAGLGDAAERTLSAYFDRAAAGLITLVTQKAREYAPKATFDEVIELVQLKKQRLGKVEISHDRFGAFRKGTGYDGFRKSIYPQDWFDTSPERDAANILDDASNIELWVRLQIGDLPILWTEGRNYNPDFIAVETGGTHWVVETKMDKEMTAPDVVAKREAASRWANHVNADPITQATWRYLLVSETDVKTAKGSWEALKSLGGFH